jgi:hypothetical protein
VLYGFFHFYRNHNEKIDSFWVDFQFWMGERDSVLSRLHPALCHYSLPQISAARSSDRTVFLPDVQAGAQPASTSNIHDFPDYRSIPRFSLLSFFLERIYIRRLKKGDRPLFLQEWGQSLSFDNARAERDSPQKKQPVPFFYLRRFCE